MAAAGMALMPHARVRGANDDIRVAVIGFRGKGADHIRGFSNMSGVRLVALSDADQAILGREVAKLEKADRKIAAHLDMRRIMDDDDIDAVVTATPNHWHALVMIWACQSGKDVYVEKPVSHTVWEGRKMAEAARKYNRIVQSGMQRRSDPANREVFAALREGMLGKMLWARTVCYTPRESIGKVDGAQPIPETVDYNLWAGPAPMSPLMRRSFHYDWHWDWQTGNGEIGNNGIHMMDLCRWALGYDHLAPRVMSIGGRLGYVDDGQTPNTHVTILDYEPAPIICEVRGLPSRKDTTLMDHYRGTRVGLVVQCEHGYFTGIDGGWIYDNNGRKIQQFKGDGGRTHRDNFIKAVRSRRRKDLNAEILDGHLSSGLCHMGNISHRLGATSSPGQIREQIKADSLALECFNRLAEHMVANEIDLAKTPLTLGPVLEMDPRTERFSGSPNQDAANRLLTRTYREPFVIRETV